jgi:isopenicillin-N N-acyltransferase like protein
MSMIQPSPLIEISGPPACESPVMAARLPRAFARELYHSLRDSCSTAAGISVLVRLFAGDRGVRADRHRGNAHGIAEGAGVLFEDTVLLNARTEILNFAERSGEDDPDGCTGIVVLPQATKAERLIHGRR